MDSRPGWDRWGLDVALTVATRADCTRRQIGAVILRQSDHAIVATGYNGAPKGQPGCLTAGACPRGQANSVAPGSSYDTGAGSCIAIHAEQNAVLRASWSDMVDSTMYVTDVPCDGCIRMLQGTPLERVIYPVAGQPNVARTIYLKEPT